MEGQMDLILSHQAMYKNAIATSGTALSDSEMSRDNVVSNLGLVRRLSNNLVLAFDGDKAGLAATARAGKIALGLGMDVKVAKLPEDMDPADLISKDGPEAWKEAVKNSKHLIEFLLDHALKVTSDPRKAGRVIKESILPYVDSIPSAIEKSHFLKKISDQASIPMEALEEDLKNIEKEQKYERSEIKNALEESNTMRRKDYIIRKLLGIVFWQKALGDKKAEHMDTGKVMSEICEILEKNPEEFEKIHEPDKEDLIFEAEVFYGSAPFVKDLKELMENLNEEILKERLGEKMRELSVAEASKDNASSEKALKEISEINQKIQNIKNGRMVK